MNVRDILAQFDSVPVVKLHCFSCHMDKYTHEGKHSMTDQELDALARKQGWKVSDGGENGMCPECMKLNATSQSEDSLFLRWTTIGGKTHEGRIVDVDSNVAIVHCSDGKERAVEL